MPFALSRHPLLIIAALFLGCNGNKHIQTYPVTGKVVFHDGKPAKGVTVKFRASEQKPVYIGIGKADESGHFQLDAGEGPNVAVVLPSFPRDVDTLTMAERNRIMNTIDPAFLEYDKSPLKFTVSTDLAKNQFQLEIWPPSR